MRRSDCINGPRPCPWVGCKYHLALDVSVFGSIQFNVGDRRETTSEADGREYRRSLRRVLPTAQQSLSESRWRQARDRFLFHWGARETCALDVAEQARSFAEIGELFGISARGAQRICEIAMGKFGVEWSSRGYQYEDLANALEGQ